MCAYCLLLSDQQHLQFGSNMEVDNEVTGFKCPYCYYEAQLYSHFERHIAKHRDEPNFMVYCNFTNCEYSTKNWNTFRQHCKRKHSSQQLFILGSSLPASEDDDHLEPMETDNYVNFIDEFGDRDNQADTNPKCVPKYQQKLATAKYAMTLEAGYKLTQKATDNVMTATKTLVHEYVDQYQNSVRKALEDRGLPTDLLDNIPVETFFDDFSSVKKRDKFYLQEFGLLEPVEVLLTKRFKTTNGTLIEKSSYGYFVPLEQNLKQLLSMPEIWKYIQNPHYSQTDLKRDVCDGEYIKNHPLFKRNPKALQLCLNTDDLEVVNPLGSHIKKHKVSTDMLL